MEGSASRAAQHGRTKRGKLPGVPFEKKYITLLEALRHSNKEQRIALLKTADKKLIKYICECALNVLQGVISLKNCEKNKLKKHKNTLRKLVSKTNKKKTKIHGKVKNVLSCKKGAVFCRFYCRQFWTQFSNLCCNSRLTWIECEKWS